MDKRLNQLFKAVTVFGIIAVVALVFRLWAIFFIALALFIGVRIWMSIIKAKMSEPMESKTRPVKRRSIRTPKGICEQVSMRVNKEFPNAKWVWAQSDTLKRVALGEDIYIILNSAGGYRRAKVCITENTVSAIEYMKVPTKVVTGPADNDRVAETISSEEFGENYDLMAYEWVEAHINDLNQRLNEAVGNGVAEYFLSAKELPIPDCWESICNELKRSGVSEALCIRDGIKIKIN